MPTKRPEKQRTADEPPLHDQPEPKHNMRLEEGVEFLRQQLAHKESQLNRLQSEVLALRQAIAILEGSAPADLPKVRSKEYEDIGITAATKRFLREVGEPQDTRTIADALIQRGLKTSSKNFVATIYATLSNAKTSFRRTDDGRWALLDAAEGTEI